VDVEDKRILLTLLPADGLDEKAVDLPPFGALVGHALHPGQLELRPEPRVEVRQLLLVRAVEV
jgi:hypothetical protein